jgi:hypothetical protein
MLSRNTAQHIAAQHSTAQVCDGWRRIYVQEECACMQAREPRQPAAVAEKGAAAALHSHLLLVLPVAAWQTPQTRRSHALHIHSSGRMHRPQTQHRWCGCARPNQGACYVQTPTSVGILDSIHLHTSMEHAHTTPVRPAVHLGGQVIHVEIHAAPHAACCPLPGAPAARRHWRLLLLPSFGVRECHRESYCECPRHP